jgi:hypothetical protein
MASVVDIWNLALSHVGSAATIAAPEEQSAGANHCRRFYPAALGCALERHSWRFASRRAQLVQVNNPISHWDFAYAVPNLCIRPRAVLFPHARDDMDEQPYEVEGTNTIDVLYTNVPNAVLKYTTLVKDVNRFTPMFTMALAFDLAALLVGPMSKDEKMKARLLQAAQYYASMAQAADANSAMSTAYRDFQPGHLAARNG